MKKIKKVKSDKVLISTFDLLEKDYEELKLKIKKSEQDEKEKGDQPRS